MADTDPILAQSADGVTHEFPAGTKPEIVDRAMKQYADERKDKTTGLQEFGRGLVDPLEGSAQLLENVTPAPIERGVNAVNNFIADKTGLLAKLPPGGMNERLRAREEEIQKERGSNTGMDWPRLAGNILNPINYIGAGLGARAAAGASLAEKVALGMERGELAGATAGAMEPATKGNYKTEKATQIGVGAGVGLLFGAAGVQVSNAMHGLGEYLARNYPDNIASQAVEKILNRINADNKAGGPTAAQAIELVNAAKKPVTLADVGGENVKGLAGHVARQPGAGREIARSFLRQRDEQAANRIDQDISKYLHGGPTVFQSLKALLNARSAAARPAYNAAHDLEGIWSPRLQQFLDSPDIKKGLARGYEIERNLALAEGRPITASQMGVDLDTQGNIKLLSTPNMRLLDMGKQGLDAMIADTRDPITGRLSQYGVSLDKVRRAFVDEMDNLDTKGVYKNARKQWAGYSSSIDAIKLGQSVFTANPEEFGAEVAELSPANREFVRIGVADKMREKLLRTGLHGDEAKSLVKNSWMREQLKPAFKSPEDFNAFADAVTEETSMFENARKFVGNSATAERMAEDAGDKTPWEEAVEKVIFGPHLAGIRDAYKLWRDIGFKPNPEVNAKIAKILFSTNVPADISTLLRKGSVPPKVNPMQGAAGAAQGVATAAAPMTTIDLTKERPNQVLSGARLAPDGNHYLPDPNRPGKYLKVVH